MKFCKSFCLILFVALSARLSFAQHVTVSPIPQSTVWGEKAFDNSATFKLVNSENADSDAVALLNEKLNISDSGIELLIGKRGDTLLSSYESDIPNVNESYYLKVESNKVVIVGNDTAGTYYGVQTFLQILSAPEIYSVTIKDFPSVIERGVIEGYYGNPYSHQDRLRLFDFFGENKMNVYIYGPKDDPYHGFGDKWRVPYPPAQANRMKELITHAHKNKVNFVWAVHPGNNISWDDNNGDGVVDDFVACKVKFEKMYDLGVRAFAVFFDDIGGIGTDPKNQAKMMNYLTNEFVKKKKGVAPLILCPTQYNRAWSGGDYLSVLGTQMDKSVRIMWTGNSVVDMINKSDMDWINGQISRKAYIWLNYPVTDYCIDHLLMGPTYGNDLNIASQLSGFTANPMEYAEASKVSLYSIADYTWNMPKYNHQTSWLRSMRYLMPDDYEAFKIFCENNIDLGPTYHGLRRAGESKAFAQMTAPFMSTVNKNNYSENQALRVKQLFESFSDACKKLNESTGNPEMIVEIKPWLDVFDLMSQRGMHLINMYEALHKEDSVFFINEYLKTDSLEKLQGTIRSRNFSGSIKAPYPKPANEVIAPFIKQLKSILVNQYRSKYNYRTDLFPTILLDNGNYYIKFNGKFLTNTNANGSGGNPIFIAQFDSINPQRQEWTIVVDPQTERYSIKNTQDNRYINELGNFGTNAYESAWHTYNLSRFNGKYAVQNAGSAGDKFWKSNGIRIAPTNDNYLSNENFIFEIIPVGQETVSYPMIEETEPYYIRYNDLYLTNNNIGGSGGIPTFNPLVTDDEKKSQLWNFTLETEQNRFKLTSVADGKYVNEFAVFGTNDYIATWNTYTLAELGGKYAIRNGGESGNKYWDIFDNRINKGNKSAMDSYLFEIINRDAITYVKKKDLLTEYSVAIEGDNLIIGAIENLIKIEIFDTNGRSVAEKQQNNSIHIANLSKGVYIVAITNATKQVGVFKLIL